jgi:sigma-E factor negative regulatory protein RseA
MADENMKETISALMDGEMEPHEIARSIDELQRDPEQRQAWQRYHLIGDALRKNIPPHLDSSFASRVSQAIAAETAPTSSVVEFKPQPKTQPQPQFSPRPSISKPLAGFAVAASVAALAYLGVGMIAVDEQAAAPRLAANAPTLAAPQLAATVPLDGIQTVQGQRWNVATPAVESKLNTYLSDHHTMSSMMAMNNRMLPNVRLVDSKPAQGE